MQASRARMADLFHRRPRLLVLTLVLIGVSGLSALQLLPRTEDPVLDGRIAHVVTRFPGASAERVEALVTNELEEELLELSAFRLVRSESRAGVSVIVLEIADHESDLEGVWDEARDAVDDARAALPPGAAAPVFEELNFAAFTLIAGLTWESPAAPPDHGALERLAAGLRDALRAVPGTDEVELFGGVREEIRVDVDGARLAALGLSARDVARAVQASDAKVSAGQVRGPGGDLLIEVQGELESLDALRRVPIRTGADGRVVRLGDIAPVERTVADPPDQFALLGGKPGVAVAARMAKGVRVDRWTADAQRVLAEQRALLPAEFGIELIFDQSRYTNARLDGLGRNLLQGVGLVIAVVLLMMGWRAGLLVGSALPLSALMACAGMSLLDISLHQMSVTGLIIALGLLIDNAIVMVDAVQARLERGLTRPAAIRAAVRALAVPLLSSTLTTGLAFMPMILMPGPTGEFVGPIASSVILALGSSLFLSLTVIPALAGRLLPAASPGAERPTWIRRGLGHPALTGAYRRLLDGLLARPALTLLLAALIPLGGFACAGQLEEQFFPPSDRDHFQLRLRLPPQASLSATLAAARQARARILAHPEVAEVHWFVGNSAPKFYYNMMSGEDGSAYFAQGMVQLHPGHPSVPIIDALQDELDEALPEAQTVVKILEQGPLFVAPIEVHLVGPDFGELRDLGERARRILGGISSVVQTRTSLAAGRPKLWLAVDEEEARLAGLENTALADQLQAALEGRVGGSILEGSEELPVRIRVQDARRAVRDLASFDLLGPDQPGGERASVPLSALGRLELRPQAGTIVHRNGRRTNTVLGFLRAGVLPSRALAEYRAALAHAGFALPPGYRLEVGGESQQRDRAVGSLLASVGVLLVLMAATLVLSFNSFRQAGIIACVGILAVGLALAALWVFAHPFGFMAIIGTMGLIGIAINDAIVVLAALRADPRARVGDPQAVREVVVGSTRHVLATTVTTVAGFVPLLVAGSAFWTPLATAVAGGVVGATLLALCLVPSAYLLLVRLGMRCPPASAEGPGPRPRPSSERAPARRDPLAVG